MFSGRFDHAIDDKGRVSIPARFREQLERDGHDRLYITNFIFEGQRCLEAYPPNEWARLQDQIRQRARFDRQVSAFELFYIGGAHEVLVDKQGRILVPPTLRDHARLKKDVVWAGAGRYAELWDGAEWAKHFETTEDERRDISSRLAELGL